MVGEMLAVVNSEQSEAADLDLVIHEPSRLVLVAILAGSDSTDFRALRDATGLTAGNLSAHLSRLTQAGYVTVEKRFVGNKPNSVYRLSKAGRAAFDRYRDLMLRLLG